MDSNTPEGKEEILESFIDEVAEDGGDGGGEGMRTKEKVYPPVIWVLG